MANNAVKAPLFRVLAKRNYSSKPCPIGGSISEIKTTVLPNKLVVASTESGSALSRLSVIFRAGSRFETVDSLGATHTLRAACGLSTKNASQFAIIRNLQQVGANLICETDRETIAYTLTGTCEAVNHGSEFLSEIANNQVFKPWELAEVSGRMQADIATLPPQARAIDLFHKAAFRKNLGNSLFCSKHRIGKISPETLQHYLTDNFGCNTAAIVGIGVDHEELISYAQNFTLPNAKEPTDCAEYHGGELRKDMGGNYAYVAIGTEGGQFCNRKDAVGFALLQRIMGTSSSVKYGQESLSLLNKAKTSHSGAAVSAFNASYSDTGVFGAFIIAPSSEAGNAITNAVGVLKTAKVSDQDVERAKKQLKLAILSEMEDGDKCISSLGYQAILTTKAATPHETCSEIDAITSADVNKCAQKIASGKLTMAAVGNLRTVPYLDELK